MSTRKQISQIPYYRVYAVINTCKRASQLRLSAARQRGSLCLSNFQTLLPASFSLRINNGFPNRIAWLESLWQCSYLSQPVGEILATDIRQDFPSRKPFLTSKESSEIAMSPRKTKCKSASAKIWQNNEIRFDLELS